MLPLLPAVVLANDGSEFTITFPNYFSSDIKSYPHR